MSKFSRDRRSRRRVRALGRTHQRAPGRSARGWRLPSGQFLVPRQRVGVPQSMHAVEAGRLTLVFRRRGAAGRTRTVNENVLVIVRRIRLGGRCGRSVRKLPHPDRAWRPDAQPRGSVVQGDPVALTGHQAPQRALRIAHWTRCPCRWLRRCGVPIRQWPPAFDFGALVLAATISPPTESSSRTEMGLSRDLAPR